MHIAVDDVLYAWAVHHSPDLLQDPEPFDGLLRFIDAVLAAAVREERAAAIRRLLRVSPS